MVIVTLHHLLTLHDSVLLLHRHAGEVHDKGSSLDKSDPVGEIILISQDSINQEENPIEEDTTSTFDADGRDTMILF